MACYLGSESLGVYRESNNNYHTITVLVAQCLKLLTTIKIHLFTAPLLQILVTFLVPLLHVFRGVKLTLFQVILQTHNEKSLFINRWSVTQHITHVLRIAQKYAIYICDILIPHDGWTVEGWRDWRFMIWFECFVTILL